MVTSAPPAPDSPVEQPQRRTDEPLLSIAAVERETGLGKDTLRAWERRYGFPLPQRDPAGVRGYPRALVDRLVLIRRALLAGRRPGRLLSMPLAELDALLAGLGPDAGEVEPSQAGRAALDLDECIAALRTPGGATLRRWLTLALARMGLASFVVDGIAPLTMALGKAWVDGRVAIYEEHLYGEAVQSVLRGALAPLQAGLESERPRVLLTTVPGETHGLDLLMAEAMLTLRTCPCLSLGTETPVADIVAAAQAHRIDVVALSFSACLGPARALPALTRLRGCLPAAIPIWVGGGSAALGGLRIAGVRLMDELGEISDAVSDWRNDCTATAD